MSEITKKSLANALYQKMKVKPLDKITIKEIVDECGLNRQTFYYHFPDIFGLLEWMFQQDAEKLMKKYNNIDVWEQGFMELLCYIKKNKAVCMCTLHSLARDELERFVYKDVHHWELWMRWEETLLCRKTAKSSLPDFILYLYVPLWYIG